MCAAAQEEPSSLPPPPSSCLARAFRHDSSTCGTTLFAAERAMRRGGLAQSARATTLAQTRVQVRYSWGGVVVQPHGAAANVGRVIRVYSFVQEPNTSAGVHLDCLSVEWRGCCVT